MAQSPTIYDVARLAQVSPTMASRILRGVRKRRDEATERVLQAATTLGYQVNQVASSLRQQDSRLLALVVPSLRNPFFAAYTETLTRVSYQHDYVVLSLVLSEPAEMLRAVQHILGYRVGAVVTAVPELAHIIRTLPWPGKLVAFARDPDEPIAYVGVDDRAAGRAVRDHLIRLGHCRWLVFAESPAIPSTRPRLEGLAEELPADIRLAVEHVEDVEGLSPERVLASLESVAPTAVVGASDALALRLYSILVHAGYRIPEDVSLVSFDGTDAVSQLVPVPLTTVVQPLTQCAEAVFACLDEEVPRRIFLPPGFRHGLSTRSLVTATS